MPFSKITEPDSDDIETMIMCVWNRCSDQIYKLCKARTMDAELAADLSQEIFIKFFGSVSRWRYHSNITAWLFLVAKRHCVDYFRKKVRRSHLYGGTWVCEEQSSYCAGKYSNFLKNSLLWKGCCLKFAFGEVIPLKKLI